MCHPRHWAFDFFSFSIPITKFNDSAVLLISVHRSWSQPFETHPASTFKRESKTVLRRTFQWCCLFLQRWGLERSQTSSNLLQASRVIYRFFSFSLLPKEWETSVTSSGPDTLPWKMIHEAHIALEASSLISILKIQCLLISPMFVSSFPQAYNLFSILSRSSQLKSTSSTLATVLSSLKSIFQIFSLDLKPPLLLNPEICSCRSRTGSQVRARNSTAEICRERSSQSWIHAEAVTCSSRIVSSI